MKKFGRFSILFLASLFVLAACNSVGGDDPPNILDQFKLVTDPPTDTILAPTGLSETHYNAIWDEVSTGYQGYEIVGDHIQMIWTGRSVNDFNKIRAYVESEFGAYTKGDPNGEGGMYGVENKDGNPYWNLMFLSTSFTDPEEGVFFPAGIMMLYFEKTGS